MSNAHYLVLSSRLKMHDKQAVVAPALIGDLASG
jgi:hypothetical protein